MADDLKAWLAQRRAAWTTKLWWGAGWARGEFSGPDLSPEQLSYVNAKGRCAQCDGRATARHWLKLVKPDGEPMGMTYLLVPRVPRGTVAECPYCGARWPMYGDQPNTSGPPNTEIVETDVAVDEDPQQAIPFDNRRGTVPYTVKRIFTAEWTQSYDIGREESTSSRQGASLGAEAGIKLESVAETVVKTGYAITEMRRTTRSDEVTFEVPAGVRRDVRIVHRRVWQHGVVRIRERNDSIDVPFRVLADLEIGYEFHDSN